MNSPGSVIDSRRGGAQVKPQQSRVYKPFDCSRILVTAPTTLVRVAVHKNTGSVKLPDADNVKGGTLAATIVRIRPAYCR